MVTAIWNKISPIKKRYQYLKKQFKYCSYFRLTNSISNITDGPIPITETSSKHLSRIATTMEDKDKWCPIRVLM
jgi:hypothetical protein